MKKTFLFLTLLTVYFPSRAQFPCRSIDLGPDQVVCSDVNVIQLINNDTLNRFTSSGTGTFEYFKENIIYYHPSLRDREMGDVLITASYHDPESCPDTKDEVKISFLPLPLVNAGADITTKGSVPATLHGTIANAADFKWMTTGSGTFGPSYTDLNATYTLSQEDIQQHSVKITLIASNGNCQAYDDVWISLMQNPYVKLPSDFYACSSHFKIRAESNSRFFQWKSSGTGYFSIGSDTLNVQYNASSRDTASGNPIKIYLICEDGVRDSVTVKIGKPSFSITTDNNITCNEVNLKVSGSNLNNIYWNCDTTGGNHVYFTNYEGFETKVISHVSTSKTLLITALSPANDNCAEIKATIGIHFLPRPVIHLPDLYEVAEGPFQINAVVSNATNYLWNDGLSGVTANGNIQRTYTPTLQEISNGFVHTFLHVSNEYCSIQDTMTAYFKTKFTLAGRTFTPNDSAAKVNFNLYQILDGKYVFIDKREGQSFFHFEKLGKGTYIVMAAIHDQDQLFGKYIPTYYEGSKDWKNATLIHVDKEDQYNLVIYMSPSDNMNTSWNKGADELSGTVTLAAAANSRMAALETVKNAMVVLYDEAGNYLTHTYTNEDGFYKFSQLAAGVYQVKVEHAGVTSTLASKNIDGNSATLEEIPMSVKEEGTITSTATPIANAQESFQLYPNPANENINVVLPEGSGENITITMMDNLGKVKSISRPDHPQSILLPIHNLTEGLYIIKITDGTTVFTKSFHKKK